MTPIWLKMAWQNVCNVRAVVQRALERQDYCFVRGWVTQEDMDKIKLLETLLALLDAEKEDLRKLVHTTAR
jgi:hypothetical protein